MKITSFISNEYWEDYYLLNDKETQEYLVSIDKEERTIYCTCPDFQYRKDNLRFGGSLLNDTENHCKHQQYILKIREVLQNG